MSTVENVPPPTEETEQHRQTPLADPLPDRYARGWHCLGLAEDYKDGKPHTLNIFGTRLVAFQGENGEISIVDAYCPHMGADLSLGHVEGDTLVCPFHHWKWGGDGVCKEIPYAKRIPPRARKIGRASC